MSETPFDALFEKIGDATDPSAARTSDPVKKAQLLSRQELPKRFYAEVEVREEAEGYRVLLDGRGIKTPARSALVLPNVSTAAAIRDEWDHQTDVIDPLTMPVTRIVNAGLDGVAQNREAVIGDIARFAESDLLFYRADDPDRLVARQNALWDPILAHVEDHLGVRFVLACGIMPVVQPESSIKAVRGALSPYSSIDLAAIHTLTSLTGSVLATLCLLIKKLTLDGLWEAAHVDEDWNRELWGVDAEAERRRERRFKEAQAAALILQANNS